VRDDGRTDHTGIAARAGAIARGVFLLVGILLIIVLWDANVGMAQNRGSSLGIYFWSIAEDVAIPSIELGVMMGLVYASAEAHRSAWETMRRIGKVAWIFVVLDSVLLWGIY
jgi:hypothetical protein